jgi:hypothetical protein
LENKRSNFVSFVLLYFKICAARANSRKRKLGFGFLSRQDAKSAKIGNIFFLKNFASLRLCEKIPRFGCGSAALGLRGERSDPHHSITLTFHHFNLPDSRSASSSAERSMAP